ncbi:MULTISPECIES: hypothetical protein [Fischerella]|nr:MULTISPECIES: hypothetical protein [Fischerella]
MDFPAVKLENLEPVYTPNETTAAKNGDRTILSFGYLMNICTYV